MKYSAILLAAVLLSTAASAQVDPSKPMVTGHGNVVRTPQRVIVANQVASAPAAAASKESPLVLENFTVTGSLLPHGPSAQSIAQRSHLSLELPGKAVPDQVNPGRVKP